MGKNFSNMPSYVLESPNYLHYVVEHDGGIMEDADKSSTYYITVINDKYAIVTIPFNDINKDRYDFRNNPFPSVLYISKYYFYTLESISPIIAANINSLQIKEPLYFTGKGVVIGLIDTGIDYLNKEFMHQDGTTRVLSIWDQTIISKTSNDSINYGTIYDNNQINEAIKVYNQGGNPYEIVPSKDEIGHGTAMAGVVGARGINPEIRGAAPECEFVVVKLREDLAIEKVFKGKTPIYSRANLMAAIDYLREYVIINNKPMVIYLPLGTTFGNHKGDGLLEDFINDISSLRGVIVVTGTGNEGDVGSHASGRILKDDEFHDIAFNVSEEQKTLRIEVWVDKPNIMSIDVISASGDRTGVINANLNQELTSKFTFENTTIEVEYFLPDALSGDELIVVDFNDLTPGVWKLRLYGDYILDGKYNAWMLQRGLAVGDTRFLAPDPYGTFTGPGSAEFICTVANYNQNNFNIVKSSGLGFQNEIKSTIDVAAGGVNVKTTAINNGVTIVNGTSVSAAVVVGACAILLQWGIVEGNYPYLYSQNIKTYLARGTLKRISDTYPNAEWGFGGLDMVSVFKYLK